MFKDSKKLFRFFLVTAVSMFLLPTVLVAFGMDSFNFRDISALLMIAGIISSLISGGIGLVIIYKSKNATLISKKAESTDNLWKEDNLEYKTRFIFYKIINAWNSSDASILEGFVTIDFLESFQQKIKTKKDDFVDDIVNSINILETRIICCQDFLNNNEDKFVGYIKWKFINPSNDSEFAEGESWKEVSDQDTGFEETYHFMRASNDWLLYETDDRVGFWNLLFQKNYYESTS